MGLSCVTKSTATATAAPPGAKTRRTPLLRIWVPVRSRQEQAAGTYQSHGAIKMQIIRRKKNVPSKSVLIALDKGKILQPSKYQTISSQMTILEICVQSGNPTRKVICRLNQNKTIKSSKIKIWCRQSLPIQRHWLVSTLYIMQFT